MCVYIYVNIKYIYICIYNIYIYVYIYIYTGVYIYIYIGIYIYFSLFCLRCTKGSLEWAGKASVNIHHRPPHSFTALAPLEKAFGAWSLEMLLPSSIGREVVGPKKS